MSIEDGGDSSKPSKLSQLELKNFERGAKLTKDSYNIWENVLAWFDEKLDAEKCGELPKLGPLQPLEHYEEYYRRKLAWNPGAVEELMERSDPSAVAAFDMIVDEFNSNLEEIVKKGRDEAMKYVRRANEIIKR